MRARSRAGARYAAPMDDRGPEQGTLDELAALADELLDQATEVRRQWSALGETLGVDVSGRAAGPETDGGATPRDALRESDGANADPMRLVALDMMLSGHSRAEVSDYLRATFGEDVRPEILDEIFNERKS